MGEMFLEIAYFDFNPKWFTLKKLVIGLPGAISV